MADYAQMSVDVVVVLLPGLVGLTVYCASLHQPFSKSPVEFALVVAASKLTQYLAVAVLPSWASKWSDLFNMTVAILVAMLAGLLLSMFSEAKDQKRRKSRADPCKAASAPMRWGAMFRGERKHVLLHLKSGGRVLGWPEGWPHEPDVGHFLLANPRDLSGGSTEIDEQSSAAVIPASDVTRVEFIDARRFAALKRGLSPLVNA
ncbi:hypothetical protein CDL60_01450 [Roseateles noduli]|nr:hypothetical protein CDL60_01450 [Roseateles noduli]